MVADPTLVGTRDIACASEGGTLLLLDGRVRTESSGATTSSTASRPRPPQAAGKIFAASTDQYLWAFDARTGDVAWRYFTESPLVDSPIYVDDDGGRGPAVGRDRRSRLPGSESRQRHRGPHRLDHRRRPEGRRSE